MKGIKLYHIIRVLILCLLIMTGADFNNRLAAQGTSCTCNCLKPLFDYLIANKRLFIRETDHVMLSSVVRDAKRAGYDISYTQCAILYKNINSYFYAVTADSIGATYTARIGDCEVSMQSSGGSINFYGLQSNACTASDPVGYHTAGSSLLAAQLTIGTCYACTTVASGFCYSAVTDTSVNAYTYGIAGNWRPYRSYMYNGDRSEQTPSLSIDPRTSGTLTGFASFWQLTGNAWKAVPDTIKWVYKTETTLYNRKGTEIENRDVLGRYNAGLYGYDDEMAIATAQNAHYRETAFDGFEDYFFGGNACDNACSGNRSFDFSKYITFLDSTQQHTGKYSLRVPKDSTYGVSANIVQSDSITFGLSFNTGKNQCPDSTVVLKSVKAGKDVLVPVFSPIAGKKILISAWAKEAQECKATSYTGNQIMVKVKLAADSTIIIAVPRGGIIEGWQRYEQVVDVPVGAVSLSVYLRSTGNSAVYFDDIRIHPYNAVMKSYVYSPSDLRMMAELDENNYATMFEYDDDGTLIRLKKETEKGIKTISETRSAMLKEE